MTERLIDTWRAKSNSPTDLAVREFLLAFRRSITLADSRGEKRINIGDNAPIVSIMTEHFCNLPETKKELDQLTLKTGRNSIIHNRNIFDAKRQIEDRWFNDNFIEALEKEGFTVMYTYVSYFKTEYEWYESFSEPYPEEIRTVNGEDYPLPMLSGGWTPFHLKSKHITREIELTWV
jgi:hypothetical protein